MHVWLKPFWLKLNRRVGKLVSFGRSSLRWHVQPSGNGMYAIKLENLRLESAPSGNTVATVDRSSTPCRTCEIARLYIQNLCMARWSDDLANAREANVEQWQMDNQSRKNVNLLDIRRMSGGKLAAFSDAQLSCKYKNAKKDQRV